MKNLMGILLVVTGCTLGVYVGFWWAFIGGAVDIIVAAKADNIVSMEIAIGATKIVFSSLIGWVVFAVFGLPGYTLIDKRS